MRPISAIALAALLITSACQPLMTGEVPDEQLTELRDRLPEVPEQPERPAPRAHFAYAPMPRSGEHPAVFQARTQLGRPYCWGGNGPDCFDCSGLVVSAWRAAGLDLPRSSHQLHTKLAKVSWQEARPGDILWRPGHVGLYVGDGWAIHAPGRGKAVRYQAAQSYREVLRPW